MSETVVSAPAAAADDVLERLEALYDQGLYRQALAAGEAAWGPLRGWRGERRRLAGSRVASHLGLFRTSAAMILAAWREARRGGATPSFDLHYAYARTVYNLRGPYLARRTLRALEPTLVLQPAERARWLGLWAVVLGAYRDWERAHAAVDEAMALAEDASRYRFERAWLEELQDRYDDALASLAAYPVRNPDGERSVLMMRARLLELTGRRDEAVAALREAFGRIESVDIGLRLHRLLMEANDVAGADACLERLRALAPDGESGVTEDLALAEAELLYRREDVDATLAALAPVRGHYFRKIRESLERARHSGRRRQLDVPFIRQHHMTCAPATLAAIWRFHGHALDHLTLAEAICYDGTSDLAERSWIEAQGWAVREFELNLDNITTLIDAGCPVGFVTVEPGSAHMQAIIGYDTRKGIYLLRDPYYPSVGEMLIEGAHEAYASTGPRCVVAVPPARRDWLFALPLRQAALYDDYFALQQALKANRRDDAVAAAARLETAAPGHRLALWAQRSLAGYDNDAPRQLQAVNALLAQFPEDLNLLASRARLLGELGREAERLQFLEDCRDRGLRHPFLLQALAEQMAQDNRRNAETQALLHDILCRQPASAAAWWTRAGVHWDSLEREEAFECYRLCLCLEDKAEGYATSFFKAARFLRRDQEALDYLRRRIDWLGARSANPWITYARALDLLERGREALAVLDEALQRHGEDAWLVDEAVGFLCGAGDYDRAERLLDEKGGVLSEVARLYKRARIASGRGDAAAELVCLRRILDLQPRNERAAANIARLLADTESTAAAIAFLDARLADNPHNLWLLHEKLTYVQRLPLDERRALVEAMHALHPGDSRLTLARARLLRGDGRHEEALRLLQEAVVIDADEERVHIALGDCCLEMGRAAQARSAYERAILISVDAAGAFDKLLATHVSFADKQAALKFIHGELMRQVSLGNGILEFQGLARRYLPDDEVRAFLEVAVEERPDLWQSWAALGEFHAETQAPDAALAVQDQAVARFPLLPRLWLDRADTHRQRGDFVAAEADLRAALAINPGYLQAVMRLADVLEQASRPDEALAVVAQGLRHEPLYAPLHGYRADLLWRMERRDEAFATLSQALRLDPEYGWGWDQLQAWSATLDRRPELRALADELVARFPDSVTLWQQCAALATESARKHDCLRRAHRLAPQRSDVLLAHCDLYAEEGRVDEARALIATAYADAEKPSEVLTYEAWLTERTGRREAAIRELEAVVARDPGHYNAWRLLTRWHDAEGHVDEACRCARHCVALYPQSATVLGMAADLLLRHLEGDEAAARKADARDYLQRALRQDHTNRYNLLTLADLYLDDGELDACAELFAQLLLDPRDPYLMTRRLRLALLRGEGAEALALYAGVLRTDEDNDWLLLEPLRWFRDKGCGEQAQATVAAVLAEADAPVRVARPWLALHLEPATPFGLTTALEALEVRPEAWREGVVFALGHGRATPVQLSPLLWRLPAAARDDGVVWGALADYRARAEDWPQLVRETARGEAPADAPARSVYYCSVAWRMQSDWRRARAFAAAALARPRDDSHHNLLFWEQFDTGLADFAAVDTDLLAALDLRELTAVERCLLDWLLVLLRLPTLADARASAALKAELARLRQANAALLGGRLLAQSRWKLTGAVLRQGPGSLPRRLLRALWYLWG